MKAPIESPPPVGTVHRTSVPGEPWVEIRVVSRVDGSEESSLLYVPEGMRHAPLVVGLHAWSANRQHQTDKMLPFCQARGWALLLPEFRGPNTTENPHPLLACASMAAKQDIVDAVQFVLAHHDVDARSIFLLGGSGGAHMALMMAAFAPALWRAVSAWCPITDLAAWHGQKEYFAPHIAACCGGAPGASAEVDAAYRDRSPICRHADIGQTDVYVHHGRYDQVVPYSHTWELSMRVEQSGQADRYFFDIFKGGHDIHHDEAFRWFDGYLASPQVGETNQT